MNNTELSGMIVELVDNYRDRHENDYDEDELTDLVKDMLDKHLTPQVKSAIDGLMVSLLIHGKLKESNATDEDS